MSAPETGIALASCPADLVELVAFRGRDADLGQLAAGWGATLPGRGTVVASAEGLALSVRPGRWLLLSPRATAGESVARWTGACQGCGAAVDLSSALAAFLLRGPAVAPVLARACRLDLDTFPSGSAAATIMVQVPAILARLTPGMLLLTPATTAQHLRDWLVETSRPFGLAQDSDAAVSDWCGESST